MRSITSTSMRSAGGVIAALACCAVVAACQAEDDRPASFDYIHAAIIAPQCATIGCHSEFGDVRGFHFDDPEQSCAIMAGYGATLVSILRAEVPGILRMPPDRPLPEADIELIEQWVMEGASCN